MATVFQRGKRTTVAEQKTSEQHSAISFSPLASTRHTTALANDQKKENRHGSSRFSGARARVFRIGSETELHETLPRNRFLLHRRLAATVGSNTETDDDCRPATCHRGRFRCETSFSLRD